MNAAEVLQAAKEAGLELAVRDGQLCVRPAGRATPDTKALITQYGEGLVEILTAGIPADAKVEKWPFEEWGDLRPCRLCRNLTRSGRCLAAWRGELRAARDYSPTFPDKPQRCFGYDPKPDDPEQTLGRERWPYLAEWQARLPD